MYGSDPQHKPSVLTWFFLSSSISNFQLFISQCMSIEQVYNWIQEGNGTPLQYSCLENPMGGGAW